MVVVEKSSNSDSLVDCVIHQELWHERDPAEGFQGIVFKYLSRVFYSFPTKMQLNCPRPEISSHVDVCSNIKIMTWGEY